MQGAAMTAAPFDTLKFSRQLRERAHFDQAQAEGVAEALAEAFQQEIATKTDLALLEQRLTIKIGAMIAAGIGILLALEKLIK
jgi:hypothetical protein